MQDIIHRMSLYIHSELKTLTRYSHKREFYMWLGVIILFFAMLYGNTLHEEFTDEYDNILGGVYILQGKLPYIGFFSHHGPFSYFLASVIALFSGHSFVRFRELYAVFLFIFSLAGYYAVRKSVGERSSRFYIGFIAVFGIAATYFWGHMLLADSLAAVLFAPAFAIIFLKSLYSTQYRIRDLIIVSVLLSCTILTSVTYSYLIFGMYLFVLIHYFTHLRRRSLYLILFPFVILGIPYAVFLGYLLVTGSFSAYLTQSIIFNQKYYIYNYPRPNGAPPTLINPVRYAIVIAYQFFVHFKDILVQAGSFNFGFPLNITLALGDLFVLIYLLYRRKYLLFFFLIFVLIFSSPRSNPLTTKESDFQAAMYYILSFINITFLLTKLWEKLTSSISANSRFIYTFLFGFLSLYAFFSALFLLNGFFTKTYNKYMGFDPLIYDRPEIAPIVNAATPDGDMAWIGPIEFKELLYLNHPTPRYQILIPGIGRSPEITNSFIAEYQKDMPSVMWFDKRFNILGTNPSQFAPQFIDFLNQNYVTLYNQDTNKKSFTSVLPITNRIDIETKLYIRKDKFDQVTNRLLQANLIKKVEK